MRISLQLTVAGEISRTIRLLIAKRYNMPSQASTELYTYSDVTVKAYVGDMKMLLAATDFSPLSSLHVT
eukprot:4456748-Karenia_brevis.AAC.1